MNIGVIGAGYVGRVAAACLAALGHDVCRVDLNENKVRQLLAGGRPIYEPGLADLIASGQAAGRLRFSSVSRDAASGRAMVFIAVGAPAAPTGEADLGFVYAAARLIAPHLSDRVVIAAKSAGPVGAGDAIAALIAQRAPDSEIAVAENAYEAVRDADAVVVLTDWPEFEALDPARLRRLMRGRLMVDFRNLFLPAAASGAGLDHVSLGRLPLAGRESTDWRLGAGADIAAFQSPPVQ